MSNHTVMGIREREGKKHSRTKKNLVSILVDVANVGAERMSEKIGKASLRDAAIETGVGVDKMLALTGQTQTVQIANIVCQAKRNAPSAVRYTSGWTLSPGVSTAGLHDDRRGSCPNV